MKLCEDCATIMRISGKELSEPWMLKQTICEECGRERFVREYEGCLQSQASKSVLTT